MYGSSEDNLNRADTFDVENFCRATQEQQGRECSTMPSDQVTVLMPVYNDWEALCQLLPALDRELKAGGFKANIVLVDDGSTIPPPQELRLAFSAIVAIEILCLKRNLGHQRAIAVGLSYLAQNKSPGSVIIMDADGEDDPRDVPRLIDACVATGAERIVFAARWKRSDGFLFPFFYFA